MSADGQVVTGGSPVGGYNHAFRWEGGTIHDLGTLGGDYSFAEGISANGQVIIGVANTAGNAALRAVRWDGLVITDLGTLGGNNSFAEALSADGQVVVGSAHIAGDAAGHAVRWDGLVITDLGTLGGTNSVASAVSADGLVVAGQSDTIGDAAYHAVRWDGLVITDLGTLGGTNSYASGISANGQVIIGQSYVAGDTGEHAVRWDGIVITDLGTLGGDSSFVSAVSADGQIIVGDASTAGNAAVHAVRWNGAAILDLGTLGGDFSTARAVSANGQVIVGSSYTAGNAANHALRWTAATGTQDLNTLLANAGVVMTGIVLYDGVAISANGQFITGTGTFDNGANEHAYIVRYDDFSGGVVAGITTPGAQQSSVNALADDRAGMMAQQHGLANPLLGGDKPITNDSEVGVFGMGGSAAGGGFARFATGGGLAILAGVSYGEEAYQDAAIEDSLMGALALRWLDPGKGLWRPLVEVGGWLAPNSDLEFQRTYMNGAGTATGTGNTEGDVSYLFARAGLVFDLGKREQLVVSGEIGRERLEVDGYTEALSAGNPFNAQVSSGTDEMDIAKARLAWSFALAPRVDATLWGAGVYGFNRESDLTATVAGVGTLAAVSDDAAAWAEYGARIGYAVTEAVTFDVFVNGVSGDDEIDTRVHGGGGLRYRF